MLHQNCIKTDVMLVQHSALTGSFVTNSAFKIMIQSNPSHAKTQESTAYLKQALAKYRSISTENTILGLLREVFA